MFKTMYGLPMLACLIVVGATGADEPARQPAATAGVQALPAGLRVQNRGNSWQTEDSGPLCTAAGITGHQRIRGENLHVPENFLSCLERGEVDAVVIGHTDPPPSGPSDLWKRIPSLLAAGSKTNPDFRIQVQMPWLCGDGRGVKSPAEYNDTDLDELQATMDNIRKGQEAWADEVNAKAGRRGLILVPLGDAMLALRKMIKAGKFPGVVNHAEVFRGDIMPHQGALAGQLGQYMHFAALYRMSPEGLDLKTDFTPEQTAILKKLAWDTVSKYPYAGIAPPPGDPKGQAPTRP
jgi:hypothetical protein